MADITRKYPPGKIFIRVIRVPSAISAAFMKSRLSLILLLLILAIAIFFRFYKLADIPAGLYPDVAINGNDALEALKNGDYKLFYPENNGREGLFINLIALSFAIFGPSVWAIKVVAAIIGVLTVLGLYLMTKEIFKLFDSPALIPTTNVNIPIKEGEVPSLAPPRDLAAGEIIALLSSFFLAISFWHVNFSRIGFRAILVPFFLVWSFYFLLKAIWLSGLYPADTDKKNKKIIFSSFWFLISGLFFGLGFHTYIAFRVAPLILIPLFLIEMAKYWPRFKLKVKSLPSESEMNLKSQKLKVINLLKEIYIKDGWWRWDIFFAAIILAALPMAIYYFQHPADFMGRAGQVSVFASESPIKTLAISTIKTLGQFVAWGDANWRHNLSGSPQIFWPLIPFFLIGIIFAFTKSFKGMKRAFLNRLKPKYYHALEYDNICPFLFLLTWFFAMLLPSVLTNEGLPHALRSSGAIPPSYIFVGLGVYLTVKYLDLKLKKYKEYLFAYKFVALSLIVIALVTVATLEYSRYFISWGQNPETDGAFTKKFVEEANYLNSLPQNVQKYVIVNEGGVPVPWPDGLPMPAQTIMFLTKIHQPETAVTYLKPEQIYSGENSIRVHISKGANQLLATAAPEQAWYGATGWQQPVAILPMAYEQNIFLQLRSQFPAGKTEIYEKEGFAVFKINF